MRLSQVRLKIQFNSIPTSYNYERSGRTTPSPPHLPPPSGSTFRWPLDCMKMKKVPLYRLASRGGGGRARKRSKPRNLIQCRPHAQTQALAPGALEGRHSKTGSASALCGGAHWWFSPLSLPLGEKIPVIFTEPQSPCFIRAPSTASSWPSLA